MSPNPSQPAIELQSVGVMRRERWILRDINWSIPPGSCAAILGPNGSGKSTLARILAGYIWPSAGEVYVNGQHFGDANLPELRQSIRLVQAAGPYDVDAELTARQVVLTGVFGTIGLFDTPSAADVDHADRLLEQVGLSAVAENVYATLSSGEKMRSLIARALIVRPKLLLLDEPTAGMDLRAREQVLATAYSLLDDPQHAPAIVFITHHVEELGPRTSSILLLSEGRAVASGPPQQVLTDAALSQAYGCPVRIHRSNGRHYAQVDPAAWNELLR